MCDDEGQQSLRAAEERLSPAAPAARAEVAQESRNEEMKEAFVTNNAENVKPRIGESREDSTEVSSRIENVKPRVEVSRGDSTEVISRMEDGNMPVGGQLASAKVSSRTEGVLPSRKRESEERGAHEDPDEGAHARVGNVHQRDDSDPQVAACGFSE